jgi:hypothetical protein
VHGPETTGASWPPPRRARDLLGDRRLRGGRCAET